MFHFINQRSAEMFSKIVEEVNYIAEQVDNVDEFAVLEKNAWPDIYCEK